MLQPAGSLKMLPRALTRIDYSPMQQFAVAQLRGGVRCTIRREFTPNPIRVTYRSHFSAITQTPSQSSGGGVLAYIRTLSR